MVIMDKRVWIVFIWFLYVVGVVIGQCKDKEFRSGSKCFRCRCELDRRCNQSTGKCQHACGAKWMGPSCQYGNIAFGKTVIGYNNQDKTKINDGKLRTCITLYNRNSFSIFLELGALFNVDRMSIYNDLPGRYPLSQISVYVGNSTNYRNNMLCFTKSGDFKTEKAQEIKCPKYLTGKNVHFTFHGKRNEMRLCEVQIYGGQNIAYGGTATQIDTWADSSSYLAASAIDGDTASLSHTASKQDTWWNVRLQSVFYINWIRIYNRVGSPERVDGFRLTISNAERVVFRYDEPEDNAVAVELTIPVTPQVDGNNVRIDLPGGGDRTYLQLNEVEIFADCPDKMFGIGCAFSCNCANVNEVCDKVYGDCSSGCKDGYQGRNCLTGCWLGTYGRNCSGRCDNCAGKFCDHVTGECKNGCIPGYKGIMCNDVCDKGTYGDKCSEQCSTCKDRTCNHVYGNCTLGCEPGYRGSMCDQECSLGHYGQDCTKTCDGCQNELCNHVDGTCTNGCRIGHTGALCEVCPMGSFGTDCRKKCSTCRRGRCGNVNGVCTDGCVAGYTGTLCKIECEKGKFGDNCGKKCVNCQNMECSHIDGECRTYCRIGYSGRSCGEVCKTGTFGGNCSNSCGACSDSKCHHVNGSCLLGCRPGYAGDTCYEELPKDKNNTPTIVGAVVGCLLAIILAVVIVALILWRRRMKESKTNQTEKTEVTYANTDGQDFQLVVPREIVNADQENQPDNERETVASSDVYEVPYASNGSGVHVDSLWDYVHKMTQKQFEKEFEKLPSGMVEPYEAAKQNMSKNRYRGIYAYDHSRVMLSPVNDEGSDYINANYIDGYRRPRVYIASQGTTEKNINDFWLMIFQQRCSTIVMLTNLVELGTIKCIRYWPEKGEKIEFGSVTITSKKEEVFSDFVIRRLVVSKEGVTRMVNQYHFTAWPDKGVPSYASSLVHFHRKMKTNLKDKNHPMIIHCSAGVGRTGTFIALDYLIDEAKSESVVNIFECILKIRKNRTSLIQTVEQYIFLHTALVEALHCKSHAMSCDEFRRLYQKLMQPDGERTLETEFEKLEKVYPDETVETWDGNKPKNISKNRTRTIIPRDNERPILHSNIPGCNDYINAVYLSGLRVRRRFIITQTPLENTVIDFWRMVYEQDTKVLVDLSAGNEIYPESQELQVGPFSVTNEKKTYETEIDSDVYSIRITYDEVRVLKLYKPQSWDHQRAVPTNIDTTIRLFDAVTQNSGSDRVGGIAVICPNGALLSGLFCVALVSLDRLQVEQEIGTGQIIKQYRSIRPQLIPRQIQLKFCYDLLMHFLEQNETYSNFA